MPESGGGTWLQPDTPERVSENLQNALGELSEQNYLRSLTDDFTFEPTVSAQARDPLVWTNWSRTEEETYFGRLKVAAEPFSGHQLELLDVNRTAVGDDQFLLDATYILNMTHSRSDEDIPTEVQGRLIWKMVRGSDGLWALSEWTDQEIANASSWSDLKAAFIK